ncbi:hypothetical protein JOB18_007366 [Solea senegalensis]|uniref:Uncharacterized protein n=1 Tax=Solea senegalensis TaxID=28829 RepID=A0AAV6S9F5_SOLSE|nr:hypothetical protein JOB18_007366 [Solea senegalensis]
MTLLSLLGTAAAGPVTHTHDSAAQKLLSHPFTLQQALTLHHERVMNPDWTQRDRLDLSLEKKEGHVSQLPTDCDLRLDT